MAKSGAIVFIEDDLDDRIFIEQVLEDIEVRNKLIWFGNTDDALAFLRETSANIFVILSDVNLPGRTGIELKRSIDTDSVLRKKSIPFVFYSTTVNQPDINEAYTQMTAQGFFRKGREYEETKKIMKIIFDYWALCKHPNTQ